MKKKTTAGLIAIVAIVVVVTSASGLVCYSQSADSKITYKYMHFGLPKFIGVASATSTEEIEIPEDYYDETLLWTVSINGPNVMELYDSFEAINKPLDEPIMIPDDITKLMKEKSYTCKEDIGGGRVKYFTGTDTVNISPTDFAVWLGVNSERSGAYQIGPNLAFLDTDGDGKPEELAAVYAMRRRQFYWEYPINFSSMAGHYLRLSSHVFKESYHECGVVMNPFDVPKEEVDSYEKLAYIENPDKIQVLPDKVIPWYDAVGKTPKELGLDKYDKGIFGDGAKVPIDEEKIKAVWLYDVDKYDTATLIADLKSAGINSIFMSTDVNNIWKYERFVKGTHENGIKVHAMILEIADNKEKRVYDYTNFYNSPYHKGKAVSDVEKVLDYNEKSLAPFDGINIDLEPYTSDLWNSDRMSVWNDYAGVLSAIHEKTKGNTVLSADVPRWYDETKIKDIAHNLDFFVIMAYDSGSAGWNTASIIEDKVAAEMGAIKGEGSKAVIGIGVHEGFEDNEGVEKCVDELCIYYSGDPAFLGISIYEHEKYSGLVDAPQEPVPTITPIPPGFEALFAITGLLVVAYLLRGRK